MAPGQGRLSPEEVELYFAAGVSVTARDLSRAERQRALAEGRALGISSSIGDFASGEASLVPLEPGDSLRKIEVVVPPGELATPCFSADREHEVWERFYDAQIRDACDGLTPEAIERLREASRVAEHIPNPPPRLAERLRRDAHRRFVGLLCRAKLGRDVEPGVELRIGQRVLRLVARRREEVADKTAPSEACATVRCDACATPAKHVAPVKYVTYDDDHYGRFELWYESPIDSGCPTCGAGIVVMLRYTLTEVTGVTPHRHFIELDTVEEKLGKLCARAP